LLSLRLVELPKLKLVNLRIGLRMHSVLLELHKKKVLLLVVVSLFCTHLLSFLN